MKIFVVRHGETEWNKEEVGLAVCSAYRDF
jgi:broad specificity phosphatase PhoE